MKKAFAWLEGNGIEYTFHDYKKLGAPDERVKVWIKKAGWERVLNTKGKTFRDLPAARQQGLNDAKAAALMGEYPSAIKRPVMESGKTLLIGFDANEYEDALR
ncbi:MAG: Spx/MgsR family RNA polymerase-binding regulatory protein [Burkholderiales bacterium]